MKKLFTFFVAAIICGGISANAATLGPIPYTQNFDNGGAWPTGWSTDNSNVWSMSTTWNGANNPGGYNVYSDYNPLETGTVFSPSFDGSVNFYIHVKFYHYWRADYSGNTQDGYLYGSRDGGLTYPYLLDEWHHNNPATEEGEKIYDISSWADGYDGITFKWVVMHNNDWYWQFDNFEIYEVAIPGLWTGAVNTSWTTPGNWDDLTVPTSTVSVTIPSGTPHEPYIGYGAVASCYNLTINSGATLTQSGSVVSNSHLNVYGNLNSDFGTFTQSGYAYLYFRGNTSAYWDDDNMDDTYRNVRIIKTNSTDEVSLWQHMTIERNLEIVEGTFLFSNNWTLTINSTGSNALEVESGGILQLANSQTIDVAGDVQFLNGSQANITGGLIRCSGDFRVEANTSYDIHLTGGLIEMFGSLADQYIEDQDGNTEFYNLLIQKSSGTCSISYGDLNVNGDLTISGGTLDPNSYNIYIAGDWTNTAGDAGFDQSTGRVIFNGGAYHQYCSNETFNELEINKTSGGDFLISGSSNVACAAYDWTAGAIGVLSGSFTANDLLDNAIQGGFYLYSGGTIDLINTGGYVDLKGDLHISGGTMTVTGSISYWPYQEDASIEMSDGVLDFTSCGITIYNTSYALADNITGGVIKTAGGFAGNRADFHPAGGTFEFYGTTDATFSQSNNCTLFNVDINKATKGASANPNKPIVSDGRIDETIGDGKSNTISLSSYFVITNNLQITSGSLTLNGYELTVFKDCHVYGILNMTNAADIFNCGTAGVISPLFFHNGSTGNLSAGEINMPDWLLIYNGASFTATTANTINFHTSETGGMMNHDPNTVFGNINVNMAGGNWCLDYGSAEAFVVNGNFTLYPGNTLDMNDETLIVHGVFTDNVTSKIYVYDVYDDPVKGKGNDLKTVSDEPKQSKGGGSKGGYLEIDTDFTLNGLLDVGDGDVLLHGDIDIASTGTLDITSGTVIADQPYQVSKAWQYLNGTINLTNGLFEVSHNSMMFSSTSVNNISGGIIRCGYTFYANNANIFKPSGGTVEITGTGANSYILCDYSNNNYFHDLLIDKTNSVLLYSDIEVKNDLTIESGPLITWHLADQWNIYVGGDWTNNGGDAAFDEGSGRVVFNGPGPLMQYFHTSETFNILENASTYAIRINSSSIDVTCNSYDWTSSGISVQNGSFTALDLADGGLYGDFFAVANSEIYLYQDASQYIDLYGNLLVQNSGLIEVHGGADESFWANGVTNSVQVTTGGVLDFVDWGITIWNTGTLNETITDGIIRTGGHFTCYRNDFIPTDGTFEFYGGTDANISVATGSTFYDVIINKSGGDKSVVQFEDRYGTTTESIKGNTAILNSNIDITNNLTINNGVLNSYYDDNINIGGDWINNVGTAGFDEGNGTVIFNGTGDVTITSGETFYNLTLDKVSSGDWLTLTDDITALGDLVVNGGALHTGDNTLDVHGNININSPANLFVQAGGTLKVGDNKDLVADLGSSFYIEGSPSNYATLTHSGAGRYNCNIFGEIAANYAVFEFMGLSGINIKEGATVNSIYTFNNCIFQNGAPAPSALLTLNNEQVFTSNNAYFENTFGNTQYNVWKHFDTGQVTFIDATGFFAGPAYEYDPNERIDWYGFIPGLWTGAVSSDWFTPENWDDYIIPDATIDVTIPAGTPNNPVINGAVAYCHNITIEAGASLEIVAGDMDVSINCNIYGELIMNNALSILNTYNILWEPGSTDNVDNGEIHCSYWNFIDGTDAVIDPGNTAYIVSGINHDDPDAEFGNVVAVPSSKDEIKMKKGLYPIRISGDFTIQDGASWAFASDCFVTGALDIENGASFQLWGAGNFMDVSSSSVIDGLLNINDNYLDAHSSFETSSTGQIVINGGEFICDYTLSSGWMNLYGDITLTTGTLEFTDGNVSFAGTSTISDGIVRAGRSIRASAAGAFQPSGGTLELTGSGFGNYIQITNGNYAYNMNVNRSDVIQPYSTSSLTILNDLTVNSTLNTVNNTITVNGDIDINSGGSLNMNANCTLEIGSGQILNVNNGGTLSVVGSSGDEAIITHSSGYYDLNVMNGGTISAEYGIFEYITTAGINLMENAIVDTGHPFDNCLFRNGTAGGRLFTVNSVQSFTVNNAIFPTNTWGGAYNVYKSVDAGVVNFNSATGGFQGEAYDYDPYNRINWTVPSFNLDLTVFLEGPFNPGTFKMDTDINGILPNNHPFNPTLPYFNNPMPDWYYTGGENTPTPNIFVIDWVLVELRDATSAAAAGPGTMIAQQAAFVLNTGEVVDLDGLNMLNFTATINDGLYVVVWHRNHLGVISANALVGSGGVYTYDFSSGSGQAYGGASAQKNIGGSGTWGMISGDGNGSGHVLTADKNAPWAIQAGTAGYLEGDYNLNGQVNNPDKNDYWVPNLGAGSFIPE